MFWIIASPWQ